MSFAGQVADGNGSYYLNSEFPGATVNLEYQNQTEGFNGTWNHIGFFEENFYEWKPKLDLAIEYLREKFNDLLKTVKENAKSGERINARTIKDYSDIKFLNPRNF